MNYTQNYHLPQWDETDRVMRTDFNQMCADIEAGLSSNREAARQEALEAAKPSYVVGSYNGTGTQMLINIGFRPSFLIVTGAELVNDSSPGYLMTYTLITGGSVLSACVTFTDTGFTLNVVDNKMAPKLLERKRYNYIAFR